MKTLKRINTQHPQGSSEKDRKHLKLVQSLAESLEQVKFLLTNSSDSFKTHAFEDSLKPLKAEIKHQRMVVYSHRKDDYLTVDVGCES